MTCALAITGCGTGEEEPGTADDADLTPTSQPDEVEPSIGSEDADLEPVPQESADSAVDGAEYTVLESFDDDIASAYWEPTALDGEPIPPVLGPHWRLFGEAGRVSLSGFDGCGGFETGESEGFSTRLVDGTLVELTLGGEAIDCGDQIRIEPKQGDRFEISADRSTIRVSNGGSTRVVLERRSDEPLGDRLTPEEEREVEAQMEADERAEAERFAAATRAEMDQLRNDLDAARTRWDAAGIEDYVIDFGAACLQCASWPTDPTAVSNRYTIVVEGGSGRGLWADSTIGASVDEWFEHLAAHLEAGGFAQASFDPDVGHPTLLYIALAGPAGTDEPVGVDEGQLSDVMLTAAALPDDDVALTGQLVASRWIPLAPDDGDIDVEQRRRHWTFSTKGRSFIIEGFDGCNTFSSLIEPDDAPGRLVDGVLVDFDVAASEAACPVGVVPLPGPMDGDRLLVIDGGARLEVVRGEQVLIELIRET